MINFVAKKFDSVYKENNLSLTSIMFYNGFMSTIILSRDDVLNVVNGLDPKSGLGPDSIQPLLMSNCA